MPHEQRGLNTVAEEATPEEATPEEIEAAYELIARTNAAEAARVRQETRDLIAPFIEAGWGSADETSAIRVAMKALREKATTMMAYDPNLLNMLFTTATIMQTVDDKIRSIAALNAEPAA
jgi:hypothetical protein